MTNPIHGISSMATRQVLAELVAAYSHNTGFVLALESVGGVDAARRVQAGEAFDVVVLGSDALDKLIESGHVASRVDLVHSGVAVAVRGGSVQPDISTEDAVRQAVLAAPTLSYSTGPSGVALAKLFERWGISEIIRSRIVVPPPGVPVGTLVARGDVALGFQQLSELMGLPGIDVLGPLPDAVQITTTFSGGLCATSSQPDAVQLLLEFLASAAADDTKRRHGMRPA